jgi:anti-sigma factor RsiW
MSSCRRSAALLEPFVDGELPAEKVLEVEQHLSDCDCCRERERLSRAVRTSLKSVTAADHEPSDEFAERVLRALAAERERSESADEDIKWAARGRPLAWRFIVPVAAAASVTLFWGATSYDTSSPATGGRAARASMATSTPGVTATVDELIDELVSYHASSPSPDVMEPSLVGKMEPQVGVPVHAPSLQRYGLRWEGASVVPVRRQSQRAASLRYTFDGHRVTLYVYNSAQFPLRATLEPRVVRNMPVYVGSRRGYSIAAVEKRGVGYAVATDLDDRESAELVVASMH